MTTGTAARPVQSLRVCGLSRFPAIKLAVARCLGVYLKQARAHGTGRRQQLARFGDWFGPILQATQSDGVTLGSQGSSERGANLVTVLIY
jgi:hypothetical protein